MNNPRTPEDIELHGDFTDGADSTYDTASPQEERLALQLRVIASMLENERLDVTEGLADIQHVAPAGLVKIDVQLMLRHVDAKDLIDLNEWIPEDHNFLVDVMTKEQLDERNRKLDMTRYVNIGLLILLFNAILYIARLKGWLL